MFANSPAAVRRKTNMTKEEKLREAVKDKDERGVAKMLAAGLSNISASRICNHHYIIFLVLAGARVNDDDLYGNTPLMIASNYGCESIVESLLEKKVSQQKKEERRERRGSCSS